MSNISGTPSGGEPSPWERLAAIPDLETDPVDPHHLAQRSVAARVGPPAAAASNSLQVPEPIDPASGARWVTPTSEAAAPLNDPRHIRVHLPADVGAAEGGSALDPGLEPEPQPVRPKRSRRSRLGWVALVLLVLGGAATAFGVYAAVLWQRIDRVDTAGTLSPASDGFVNYLVVGTDDRSGIDASDPVAGDVGLGFEGTRSDSMIVLRIGDDGNRMVSLPRDLWIDIDGLGSNKLNAALATGGPPRLIATVTQRLGIPIHRYLQVDLAGFMDVIDAVGGITVEFPRSACDPKSGLDVRQTGPVPLDRRTALQYVRSRTYTEFDAASAQGLNCAQLRAAGLGRTDPTGDIGRTERQRQVLLTTLSAAAGSRNPVRLLRVMSGLQGGLTVDDEMGIGAAFSLARSARGLDAETVSLPVAGFTASGGASALQLTAASGAVLDRFRQ